jgi:hypothetical protein
LSTFYAQTPRTDMQRAPARSEAKAMRTREGRALASSPCMKSWTSLSTARACEEVSAAPTQRIADSDGRDAHLDDARVEEEASRDRVEDTDREERLRRVGIVAAVDAHADGDADRGDELVAYDRREDGDGQHERCVGLKGQKQTGSTHAKDGAHDPFVPALAGGKLQLADARAERETLKELVEDNLWWGSTPQRTKWSARHSTAWSEACSTYSDEQRCPLGSTGNTERDLKRRGQRQR